jgi:hypothetical protein
VPRYLTTVVVPAPLETTFAYVSDFRHAPTWDPRATGASRTDGDGPIGLGASFAIESPGPFGRLVFPYRIVRWEPLTRVTFQGETTFARYQDDLTFTADGTQTRVCYDARFDLRGLFVLGTPVMRLLFRRIGDDATRGIPGAVARAIAARP